MVLVLLTSFKKACIRLGDSSSFLNTGALSESNVMAFGDGDNDLELLQMAGRSYAMENASPAILQVADQIAPHHKDQGVLTVLEDYLGLV